MEVGNIKVETQLHIITARAEVRNLARDLGFSTMDQARISLATSTLANLMDLSSGHPGVIIYGQEDVDHAPNLYVICRTTGGENNGRHKGPDESRLNQLRRMLDELSIESLPSHDIQVRMVMKGRKRSGA